MSASAIRSRLWRLLRQRRGNRGYTLVEVMMSMAILAVGATGVIAVQKTAIWGNVASRHLVTANSVAMTWAERLRQDALNWNVDGTDRNNDTEWLIDANIDAGWVRPATIDPLGSSEADVMGRDVFAAETVAYCTNIRLTEVVADEVLRAEIRVHWSKDMQPVDCTFIPTDDPAEMQDFGFIYFTTAVGRNPLN